MMRQIPNFQSPIAPKVLVGSKNLGVQKWYGQPLHAQVWGEKFRDFLFICHVWSELEYRIAVHSF